MISKCVATDFNTIYEIINDGASAYRGIIPADRWKEPYMSAGELQQQIDDQVQFWKYTENENILGVMGIQSKGDVTLIRHAYVRTAARGKGIGGKLLTHLESVCDSPILIGTWAAANWAIGFYEKHGFRLANEQEKNTLLKKYWTIPERQIETSVVLASINWNNN